MTFWDHLLSTVKHEKFTAFWFSILSFYQFTSLTHIVFYCNGHNLSQLFFQFTFPHNLRQLLSVAFFTKCEPVSFSWPFHIIWDIFFFSSPFYIIWASSSTWPFHIIRANFFQLTFSHNQVKFLSVNLFT